MAADPQSDQQDFAALRAGDDLALNRIMERWERPLWAFAYRYLQNEADAQDIVVEAFVRLYEHRQSLESDTRLSAWLFTTTANLCRNQLRWRRRHPSVSDDPSMGDDAETAVERLATNEPNPLTRALDQEALAAVQDSVQELPHDLRVTVLLYYYERLSYREIGEVLACSERGVETRLYRARQHMRPALERYFERHSVS